LPSAVGNVRADRGSVFAQTAGVVVATQKRRAAMDAAVENALAGPTYVSPARAEVSSFVECGRRERARAIAPASRGFGSFGVLSENANPRCLRRAVQCSN